jgi:hypothetical protein
MSAPYRLRPREAGEGDRGAQRRGGGGGRPAPTSNLPLAGRSKNRSAIFRVGVLQTWATHPICSRYVPTGPQPDPASRRIPAAKGARPVRRGPPHQIPDEQLSCRSAANPFTAQEKPPRSAPGQPQRLAPRPPHGRLSGLLPRPARPDGAPGAQTRSVRRRRPIAETRRPEPRGPRRSARGAASHRLRLGHVVGTTR